MTLDVFRLEDRVAIVTGGSKGLGEAMARALAEAGSHVVIVSRNLQESQKVANGIAAETGRQTLALRVDVTLRVEVEKMVEETVSKFGKIDILVNNAGINIRKPLRELADEEWQTVLGINLTGPMLCSRTVSKFMIDRRSGSIINISSTLGHIGFPARAAYSSSKAGLIGLTRTLALEWAPYNVRVNALCPGPFQTPMNQVLMQNQEAFQQFLSRIPMGRFADPKELAGPVVFLASDASSFMTGTTLLIDGGWTAQ
jgi:NAD(P)-dependent dehydrogenase (short-subunit alcohol dehydrogenase family)